MLSRCKTFIAIILLIFKTTQCKASYFAIEQCPGTDVANIRHQTQFYEVSMIFYYTQWSDESLEALNVYNDVAKLYGDKVYFSTIDCWHLQCNCSKTLETVVGSGSPHKWPTLMAYYGKRGQLKIQYHGLFVLPDMVQFLEHIMYPLERLEWKEEVDKMKWLSDAVIMGVFENSDAVEYKHYMMASLKWLEYDPLRTYRFAITFANTITKNLNESQEVKIPNLLFMGHSKRKSFKDYHNPTWNASNIIQWLQQELDDDYSLHHGYTTPITIAQKLKKNPVLAIFVNRPNEFYPYMEKYIDFARPFTKANLACIRRKTKKFTIFDSLQIIQILEKSKIFTDNIECHYSCNIILKNLQYYYPINGYLNDFYEKRTNPFRDFDQLRIENAEKLEFFHKTKCLQNDLAVSSPLQIGIVKRLENFLENETNFLYKNQTISVVLLAKQRYKDYLENLAILPTPQSMATAFVVDKERESIFVMEDKFTIYKLMEFLKKFYTNHLVNYFRNENISKTVYQSSSSSSSSSSHSANEIDLNHVNRYIFLNYLQYCHNQTLIVLIYSPECALCGNILHTFLQLSSSLRHLTDLKFIRINSLHNDLPWQFNMPFLPSLLVFPKERFSDSRLFPLDLKPDIRNVLAFILNQLSAQDQVKVALTLCQGGTLPTNHTQSCWQFAKTLLMQHIGKHLQYWQMFEMERSVIFERLRAFKDMSLDIQRNLRL